MTFYYYKIVNLKNNKNYIGITENIQRREKEHFSLLENHSHSNSKLQTDYNLMGRDSFQFIMIEEKNFNSPEEAYEYEYELITKYKTLSTGYNIAMGGKLNPMYTESIRNKMIATKQAAVPNIIQLEEISENIFKYVATFNSQKEAQRITGCSQKNIWSSINNRVKGSGFYWINEEDLDSFEKTWKPKRTYNFSPIAQLDNEGNIIKVHYSCGEFEREYGWAKSSIGPAIFRGGKCHGIKFIKISEEIYYQYLPITLIR